MSTQNSDEKKDRYVIRQIPNSDGWHPSSERTDYWLGEDIIKHLYWTQKFETAWIFDDLNEAQLVKAKLVMPAEVASYEIAQLLLIMEKVNNGQ